MDILNLILWWVNGFVIVEYQRLVPRNAGSHYSVKTGSENERGDFGSSWAAFKWAVVRSRAGVVTDFSKDFSQPGRN